MQLSYSIKESCSLIGVGQTKLYDEPPPIKESMRDSESAIHNGGFMGAIFHGKEISYGGTNHREAASG